jgi:imidazole glycerol-phosphate synthase subunit HisF
MTRIRVIPVLLLSGNGMVKTKRFTKPRYLGDPINAVKIFNEKRADELAILDIEATAKGRIDFNWISDIVSEAFMPIAYGGGITSLDQCVELFKRGVEKVVINSAFPDRPQLIAEVAERFGVQAVVVSIDVKKNLWKTNKVYTRNGRKDAKLDPVEVARKAEQFGAGEIILTSIEREGTFSGYDTALLQSVASAVCIPVVANGGAAGIADFEAAVNIGKCSAVAASSMFVFAAKDGGVLISYPSEAELQEQLWKRVD